MMVSSLQTFPTTQSQFPQDSLFLTKVSVEKPLYLTPQKANVASSSIWLICQMETNLKEHLMYDVS